VGGSQPPQILKFCHYFKPQKKKKKQVVERERMGLIGAIGRREAPVRRGLVEKGVTWGLSREKLGGTGDRCSPGELDIADKRG